VIDHIGIHVKDVKKSLAFFRKVLEPLGYSASSEDAAASKKGQTTLYLLADGPTTKMHLAFKANSRAVVDKFHALALEAGARENGGPGIRSDYNPNYYAAFVIDPDGNNVEAVCMRGNR
jgi:catechol 2,3-dioxygenase-like lactoylglutathione lyase family enzyme